MHGEHHLDRGLNRALASTVVNGGFRKSRSFAKVTKGPLQTPPPLSA